MPQLMVMNQMEITVINDVFDYNTEGTTKTS